MPQLTPYILITLLSAAIIAAMGICLLALSVPGEPELRNYRISRRFLGAAYIALALQSIFGVLWNIRIHTDLFVPLLQAFLFTYSLITLLNLGYVTLRRVLSQCGVIGALCVLILIDTYALPAPAPVLTQLVRFGYFSLFGYYVWIFFREYRGFKRRADNFYAGEERNFLRWVLGLFVMAAVIGAAAGTMTGDNLYFRIFIVSYTFLYVYMAIRYIDYLTLFRRIAPAVSALETDVHPDREPGEPIGEELALWLDAKQYLARDITLEGLAVTLNTNTAYLSRFINKEYGQNFRSWIGTLRIRESMRLMDWNPELSMTELAEKSGIPNLSTFYRQFSAVTGITPAVYRKQNGGSDSVRP